MALPRSASLEMVLKIVPLSECSLAHPSIDRAIRLLSTLDLTPAWNTYDHTGVWGIVLRHGGGLLVNLLTSSEATEEHVQYVCDQLCSLPDVRGVLWTINDGVAEVATGDSNLFCMVSYFGNHSLRKTLKSPMMVLHKSMTKVQNS